LELAHLYRAEKKFTDLVQSHDKALETQPSAYGVWRDWGKLMADVAGFSKAVLSYERALEINSQDCWPYLLLSLFFCSALELYWAGTFIFEFLVENVWLDNIISSRPKIAKPVPGS
jgi:tetratricopeptide (TPR) repeat protein